ncbi:hypothetical protein V492_00976 [Pseudogymnoascus sp. VKM F-4246]|nr:hypothetical protein V492_00976 [Pseudogymnoascus sp. VKM F-4246]
MDSPSPSTCKSHMVCLIQHIDEINKADMASATVLLGLAPAMLAMVGPNIAEISLLSSKRPILSFLIAMSAPALNIGSLFEFRSPVQVLRDQRKELKFTTKISSSFTSKSLYIIVVLQYAFLLGSIANVATNSIQLGVYTVVSWKCQATYMPVLWTSLAVAPWLAAFFYAKYYNWKTVDAPKNVEEFGQIGTEGNQKGCWLGDEFSTFELRPYTFKLQSDYDPTWATSVNALSWIFVYVLLWYGTLVMSSLWFISTLDALTVIIRYLASAVVSRLVLRYELEGISWFLKTDDEEEEKKTWEALKTEKEKAKEKVMRSSLTLSQSTFLGTAC